MSGRLPADQNVCDAMSQALREAREKAGLTRVQLGERLLCHYACIHNYEAGARNVGLQLAWRVAEALGVRLSEIVARAEEIHAAQ